MGLVLISPMPGATIIFQPSSPNESPRSMQISNNVLKHRSVVVTVVKIGRIHQSKLISPGRDVYPRGSRVSVSPTVRGSKKTYFPKGPGLKINILR